VLRDIISRPSAAVVTEHLDMARQKVFIETGFGP